MKFVINAYGHPNLLGNHKSTWEITKDEKLSESGDCIIGVLASCGPKDLPNELKNYLIEGKWVIVTIKQDNNMIIEGKFQGHHEMNFSNSSDMVFRRSGYVDDRTVGIYSSFVAKDIPRNFIEENRTYNSQFFIVFSYNIDK